MKMQRESSFFFSLWTNSLFSFQFFFLSLSLVGNVTCNQIMLCVRPTVIVNFIIVDAIFKFLIVVDLLNLVDDVRSNFTFLGGYSRVKTGKVWFVILEVKNIYILGEFDWGEEIKKKKTEKKRVFNEAPGPGAGPNDNIALLLFSL